MRRRLDDLVFGRDMHEMAARFVGCQIIAALLPLFGLCGLVAFLAGRCR